MKLKDFIKKLEIIVKEKGDDLEVIMADNIPVVSPKFSDRYSKLKSCVIITDQE
jgi:hypothetical protein